MRSRGEALSDAATLNREVIAYSRSLWPQLEPTWRALLARAGESSPFLSAQWLGGWVEAFGSAMRPTALVWRDGRGDPAGCALVSAGKASFGPLTLRCAYLNATGMPDVSSEHNDVLCLPEHREAIVHDLARVIRADGYDELALTGARSAMADELRAAWSVDATEGYVSEAPYIALDRLRAERKPYASCLSSTVASQVRRSIRLYRASLGYERVDIARSGDQALAWFDELIALHEERWRSKGQAGSFSRPEVRRFHERLLAHAPGGPDELVAEVLRVRFGDETIGLLYTLSCRGRVCFYQSGLQYHPDNRLKPGFVTHALAAEHYLQAGAVEYDFLGGEPVPVRYKRSLATDVRMLAWLRLPSPSVKMQTLYAMRRLARRLRHRGDRYQDHGRTIHIRSGRSTGEEGHIAARNGRGEPVRPDAVA